MALFVPAKLQAGITELLTHYPQKRSATLMVLHAFQEHFGYISREALEWIAARLELQPINVYELVTFYPMLRQQPVGKYQLKVCRTLSCALSGSYSLREHLCRKFGLDPEGHGPQTTTDGKYTVEFVECLASCGSGPIMLVNDECYQHVSPEKADKILEECNQA